MLQLLENISWHILSRRETPYVICILYTHWNHSGVDDLNWTWLRAVAARHLGVELADCAGDGHVAELLVQSPPFRAADAARKRCACQQEDQFAAGFRQRWNLGAHHYPVDKNRVSTRACLPGQPGIQIQPGKRNTKFTKFTIITKYGLWKLYKPPNKKVEFLNV